jgi:hypothetical protein
MTFKEYYVGSASINNTSTKSVSYKYSPAEDSNSSGNPVANTENEEKLKRKKKIKKFINYKGKYGMFNKSNIPVGVKGPTPTI